MKISDIIPYNGLMPCMIWVKEKKDECLFQKAIEQQIKEGKKAP